MEFPKKDVGEVESRPKAPSEEGQGLPDAVRRGNRMRGAILVVKTGAGTEKVRYYGTNATKHLS